MSIQKRYDFVYLFDVKDGNPNGDPDAGNLPRLDPETGMGLVTDVCLKRKVRNFIEKTQKPNNNYDIFIRERAILNQLIDESYEHEEIKSKEKKEDKINAARHYMCQRYYDVRTFGAVMTTGKNAGQVRGPVQLTFSRSIDPIVILEHTITRMAVTSEKSAIETGDNRTMGRKFTVPYGLYRCHGFISAHFAEQTGFSEKDLELFWNALIHMFEDDHSAARGQMNVRGLYVFEHEGLLGNAPAYQLFERIQVQRKKDVDVVRQFADYDVNIDESNLGLVKLLRKLG